MYAEQISEGCNYCVLRNDEEQYSLWPYDREVPAGWDRTGFSGTKMQCMEYVKEVWLDMRPKSVREGPAN